MIAWLREHAELASGGALLVAGLAGILSQLYLRRRAAASLAWPSVTGRVVASRASYFGRGGSTGETGDINFGEPAQHTLVIEYAYEVGGHAYTSDVYAHGDAPRGTRAFVSGEAARRFAPGTPVQVFYDPAKPADAVLAPGRTDGIGSYLLLFAGFVAAGVWLVWRAVTGSD